MNQGLIKDTVNVFDVKIWNALKGYKNVKEA